MNRKHFVSSLLAASAAIPALGATISDDNDAEKALIIPRYLKPGDTIGITSPAGYITLQDIQPAMQQIQSWGLNIRVGNTIGKRDFTFGGTDEERAADFQQMLDDISIKAIMCARGGYGAVRITSANCCSTPNGLSALAILLLFIHTSTAIMVLLLSIQKCATVSLTTGTRLNPYRWKPYCLLSRH
jgi:hypothetical protein